MSKTSDRPTRTNLSPSRTLDGVSKDAAAIPAVAPHTNPCSDVAATIAEPPAAAPDGAFFAKEVSHEYHGFGCIAFDSHRCYFTDRGHSTPDLKTQVSPAGVIDRLVRIREHSRIQREKDKAHSLAGTDPFYEDGDKVWDELQEEQCAAADDVLSRSPKSIADLAWQAEAVLVCDGPDMSESKKVYGLVQLFENVRALAGPLAIPSAVSFPQMVDPVFAEIERHRALSIAFDTAAENSTSVADSHPDKDDLDEISGQASSELIEQAQKLFEFWPASLSGIAALLKYIASLKDWQLPGRFSEPEEIEGMQDLCRTIAAAIEPFSAVRRVATSSFANDGGDPIFAAIEAHRAAAAEFDRLNAAYCKTETKVKKETGKLSPIDPRCIAAAEARDDADEAMLDAAREFLEVAPTTIAGTTALLEYAASSAHDEEWRFPMFVDEDEEGEYFAGAIMRHVSAALAKFEV